jgi:glycerophosphoryl diester phosphodiesterase
MKIYAHRGYSAKFPEGTKRAYLEAVKAGADGFECDVRLTRDNEIVCFHDRTTKRLAGVSHTVSRSTLVELQELVDVITLDELIDIAIEAKKDLLIETKHPVRTGGRIERLVVALLHSRKEEIFRSGIQVTVMSFSFFAVRKLKKNYPLVAKVVKYRAATLLSQNEHLAVNIELLRSKRVQKKLLSRQVLLWTVNQEKQLTQAANLKIEGVITDEVTKAKVLLKPSASI